MGRDHRLALEDGDRGVRVAGGELAGDREADDPCPDHREIAPCGGHGLGGVFAHAPRLWLWVEPAAGEQADRVAREAAHATTIAREWEVVQFEPG